MRVDEENAKTEEDLPTHTIFELIQKTSKRKITKYRHHNTRKADIDNYTDQLKNEGVNLIGRIRNIHKNVKLNLAMKYVFKKMEDENIEVFHNLQLQNSIIRGKNELSNF